MERDDVIEYSLDAHHSEEQGRKIRRKIWMVTVIMAVITAVEVYLGAAWRGLFPDSWQTIKALFIVLTLVKAAFIVMSFMHLGEERRNVRAMILLPYALFVLYLIWIALTESNFIERALQHFL